ncbi:MAG TPA: alpha-glucan family phosphorylase, partial [Candidatus Wirthbacteria bacterium]|nr:alpha-glucan family phosphorylase [Candidatus Wirthbacteria bacterium]
MIRMIDFKQTLVAYFSMEIGLQNDIPTYSGGLGVLSGDTLRSCADLQLPVVAVSLLYKKGYFRQKLDATGKQTEEDMRWDTKAHMQILPNEVVVNIEGREVKVRAWVYPLQGITGQINPVVFLDTDIESNTEKDREITQRLYGYDEKYRLKQEAILGIGGVRMLKSIGCDQIVKYHMNEGHSSLLTLELLREADKEKGDAIEQVRDKCVFTTHTPVPAGHDQFPRALAEQVLGDYLPKDLAELVYYEDKLNMTHLGLRFSEYVNGVAKKHGEVSRDMFPDYHIDSITNGVHAFCWTASPFRKLFDTCLPGWTTDPLALRGVLGIKQRRIWEAHLECKRSLIDYVNSRFKSGLSEKIFTIGFARRAATYKRADLLFSDLKRLKSIAQNSKGGIQIIYAGKAHPRDEAGKEVIQRIMAAMQSLKGVIDCCYIPDYDMDIAKVLIPGVDVWLNTPQRPHEASGTSGMKAALNGVPHFSVLDGWWLEGHIEGLTGFSIGGTAFHEAELDYQREVEDLYGKLEYVILPTYYLDRDRWINIM